MEDELVAHPIGNL